MWRLWEMLNATKKPDESPPGGLSLNDTPESLSAWANSTSSRPYGTGGKKLRFVMNALGRPGQAQCVIVGHLHQAPVAWLAWLLGRIDRYIVVLHGIEAWRRANWFQRHALRHAYAVVATTNFTARTCAEANNLPNRNFRVIPLCAEPEPAATDTAFSLDGKFPILFVGRLARSERYKGLETLMQAVKCLRDGDVPVKLHVVGDGDDRLRLQALSRSIGLTTHEIAFHGRVSDAALQSAYASTKVFAMPSAKEGFGIVFLEAMRHGVVCIGGAHGGTPEVFADRKEGYCVKYGNVNELTACIQILFNDPSTRTKMARAAAERFNSDYTFSTFARRWADLLFD